MVADCDSTIVQSTALADSAPPWQRHHHPPHHLLTTAPCFRLASTTTRRTHHSLPPSAPPTPPITATTQSLPPTHHLTTHPHILSSISLPLHTPSPSSSSSRHGSRCSVVAAGAVCVRAAAAVRARCGSGQELRGADLVYQGVGELGVLRAGGRVPRLQPAH